MKLFDYALLALLMCASALTVAQAPDLESMDIVTKSVPDGPVARVGKHIIEKIDFVLLYHSKLNRFAQNNPDVTLRDENRVRIALNCMKILVEQELLHQEAVTHKLSVSADEVNKQADAQYERLKKGFSKTAGRDVTEKEILERLGYQHRNEINDEIKRAILIANMRKRIMEEHKKSIPDSAIEEMYEKNKERFVALDITHLRQIFIKAETTDAALRAVANKKAVAALERLFSGQRFDTVAKEVSQATDAEKGGDMGFTPTLGLLPVMSEALKSMENDDISEVLESEFGYHIIQLVARKTTEGVPKDKAYSMIRNQMSRQQGQLVVRQYCDRLIKSGTRVDVFLELEENLARITGKSNGAAQ